MMHTSHVIVSVVLDSVLQHSYITNVKPRINKSEKRKKKKIHQTLLLPSMCSEECLILLYLALGLLAVKSLDSNVVLEATFITILYALGLHMPRLLFIQRLQCTLKGYSFRDNSEGYSFR